MPLGCLDLERCCLLLWPSHFWSMGNITSKGFPGASVVKKNLPAMQENADVGSILGSGRSPGEGNGNPLQYSCLSNTMDRRAWWASVHGVASQAWLSNQTTYLQIRTLELNTHPLTPGAINLNWIWDQSPIRSGKVFHRMNQHDLAITKSAAFQMVHFTSFPSCLSRQRFSSKLPKYHCLLPKWVTIPLVTLGMRL